MTESLGSIGPIKIMGMNIVRDRKPWDNGDRLIAHFDAEVHGFAIFGASLIKTSRHGFVARLPKIENRRGNSRSVDIIDESLRHHLMDAARRAYVAFGGDGGEWEPRIEREKSEAET